MFFDSRCNELGVTNGVIVEQRHCVHH